MHIFKNANSSTCNKNSIFPSLRLFRILANSFYSFYHYPNRYRNFYESNDTNMYTNISYLMSSRFKRIITWEKKYKIWVEIINMQGKGSIFDFMNIVLPKRWVSTQGYLGLTTALYKRYPYRFTDISPPNLQPSRDLRVITILTEIPPRPTFKRTTVQMEQFTSNNTLKIELKIKCKLNVFRFL